MEKQHFTIFYFSATHWDREWYQPFQEFRFRLVDMMNELIDFMENSPDFRVFHLDGQTIVLEDFLQIEPNKRERLEDLIQQGRILIGPWYVMPDEFILSGESLISNLLKGRRKAAEFGVEAWKFGYICDIFGHIAQMPQIFNGFGIQQALLGRGTNEHTTAPFFRWKSPDGSECVVFKVPDQSGYGSFYMDVLEKSAGKGEEALKGRIREYLDREMARANIPVAVVMDGMDHEGIHTETMSYIQYIQEMYPESTVRHTDLRELEAAIQPFREQLAIKEGELNEPAKGKGLFLHLITHTLSSRYPLKVANDQCQTLLEKWVEPLLGILGLMGFRIQDTYRDLAYRYLLQNQAHDSICGCSVDQVHRDMVYRFDQSRIISCLLVEKALEFYVKCLKETRKVVSDHEWKKNLVVWNPLPFTRHEVISIDLDFETDYPFHFQEPFGYEKKNSIRLVDYKGNEIPYGIREIKRNLTVRTQDQKTVAVDRYTLLFKAELPSAGTAEYAVLPVETPTRYLQTMLRHEYAAENQYIILEINADGTLRITDKETGKLYDGLLAYTDDGEIGDGWFHVSPVEDMVIGSIGSSCTIKRVFTSAVSTCFQIIRHLHVPKEIHRSSHGICRSSETVELRITTTVQLSTGARYIDVETQVENNARDHRLRLLLPTGVNTEHYFASQPFAFVERRSGRDVSTADWKECEPYEKQMGGIVGKRDENGCGLAFISAWGLHECAGLDDCDGTLAVTLFRSFCKTVMTNGEEDGQIIGTHQFKYRLCPMKPETSRAELVRIQEALQAGTNKTLLEKEDFRDPGPPVSFLSVEGEDVCMSILKQPDNREESCLIVRLYNLGETETKFRLYGFEKIKCALEVRLDEETVAAIQLDAGVLSDSLKIAQIKTYKLFF